MPTTLPAYSTPNTLDFAAGSHTRLATELNRAMASNWGARHLYLTTYGTPWVALPTPGVVPDAPLTMSAQTVACPVITDEEAIAGLRALSAR